MAKKGSKRLTPLSKISSCPSGSYNHPLYATYVSMLLRCYNPKDRDYHRYGGANPPIKVCDHWLVSGIGFINFCNDVSPRPDGKTKGGKPLYSLDRYPNPYGNYEPENVRWATAKEQANNCREGSIRGRKTRFDLDLIENLLVNTRLTYKEIATKLGMNRAYLGRIATSLGVIRAEKISYPEQLKLEIIEWVKDSSNSYPVIAYHFKIPVHHVKKIAKEFGIEKRVSGRKYNV